MQEPIKNILFIKSCLPVEYDIQESKSGTINCRSNGKGIKPFNCEWEKGKVDTDPAWSFFKFRIKQYFGDRFQEIFHTTCTNHIDFTIYLKPDGTSI